MSDLTLPEKGDRIRLIEMPHDPTPVPPGTLGTVTEVVVFPEPIAASYSIWEGHRPVETQLPAPDIEAQLWVEWDNGSTLNLMLPGDRWEPADG